MSFHPLHLSMTGFDYYKADKKCVISIRVFSDDFAALMRDKFGNGSFSTGDSVAMNDSSVIRQYFNDNLKFSLNGQRIPVAQWRLDSVKNNYEASWIYYSFEFGDLLQEISVRNTIFFDSFRDQKNLMIIGNGDQEKAIQFSSRKPVITIRF